MIDAGHQTAEAPVPLAARGVRLPVLFNASAGSSGYNADQIESALRAAGLDPDVRVVPGKALGESARDCSAQSPVVVAAGGDGTVATVAAALVGTSAALGVLPAGTLNHFARDLGVPPDLAAAARVIAAGGVRRVDVGDVNGHYFLNNASIGLYPRIVRRREGLRRHPGRGKWLAMGAAVVWAFRRFPLVHVSIELPGRALRCATPLAFVGNNHYEIDLLNLGRRPDLARGELCVYLVNAPGRLKLLRLAVRALFGRLRQDRDFEALTIDELRIDTKRRRPRVALDGEVLRLAPPLQFRIHAAALRVLAP